MEVLVVALITLVFIGIRFYSWFEAPWRVVEPYGDGYKAYTAIQYHAQHDSTFSHFNGMNYPFGEHAAPAVTQPLVSGILHFISENITPVAQHTNLVVNMLMLLSVLLCVVFIFLLFRKLDVPAWYAGAAAIGITFLAPQMHRMMAHYGLSHLEAIPILLYLLLCFDRTMKWKYSIWIAVITLLFPLIHTYYFAIFAFTISFYFLFRFLTKPDLGNLRTLAGHYAVQMVLPLSFFIYWLVLMNPIADRTPEPWGFFAFNLKWDGVVTSLEQPHFRWLNDHVLKIRPMGNESRAYIGLATIIGALLMVFRALITRNFQVLAGFQDSNRRYLKLMFWTSLIVLFISMGLPFTIEGLEHLLDYSGPFRQFRSVGRFAWLFYFVITITVLSWLYLWLKDHRFKYVFFAAILGSLWLEAYFFSTSINVGLDKVDELEAGSSFPETIDLDFGDYQAILTVPYYNIGSDQFYWEPEGFIIQKSLTLSIQTGLPTTSAAMTRSSRSQTLQQLQLVTEPYREPTLLEALPNDKPFLMLLDQREFEKERGRYQHLLEGSKLLYSKGDRFRLYEVPISSFAERLNSKRKEVEEKIAKDSVLTNLFAADSTMTPYYNSLDEFQADRHYFGNGGYQGDISEPNVFEIPNMWYQTANEEYILSMWMYVDADRRTRAQFHLEEFDSNNQVIAQKKLEAFKIIDLFDNNGWALVELPFTPVSEKSHFKLTVSNPRLKGETIFLDELLVRPGWLEVYRKEPGYNWLNNRYYPVSN